MKKWLMFLAVAALAWHYWPRESFSDDSRIVVVTDRVRGCLFPGGHCEWFVPGTRLIAKRNLSENVFVLRSAGDKIGYWIPEKYLRPERASAPPAPVQAVVAWPDAVGCIAQPDANRIFFVAAPDPVWLKSVFDRGECATLGVGERVTVTRRTDGSSFALLHVLRDGAARAYWVPAGYFNPDRAP